MRQRVGGFIIVSVLFAFSILLRVLNYAELPAYPDEISYTFYTFSILAHNWHWPPEFMLGHPPLMPYLLAILTHLFGGSLEVLRTVSTLFSSMTVVVVYFLGKELFNRKVGVLSAILLCFCSYHILYGKILMLESAIIFFIFLSLYFFWKAQNDGKLGYAIAAGIFLGLANDTKYISLLMYPVIILFVLWTKRRWEFMSGLKELMEKRVLTTFFVSFLVFLPVLIALHVHGKGPISYLLFSKFKASGETFAGYKSFSFVDLIIRGFNNYVGMMIDAENPVTASISWHPAYRLAASFLLVSVISYFLYLTFKGKNNASLLFIFFIVFNVFVVLYKQKFQYYLLWAFPAFLIMLSSMSIDFVEKIKNKLKSNSTSSADFFRVLFLLFSCIFIFSSVIIGLASPHNESVFVGYESQIIKIKENIQPGDSITTDVNMIHLVNYYLDKYDFDAERCNNRIFPLYKMIFRHRIKRGVDLEMLDIVKPRFILTSAYYHSAYADKYEEMIIRKNYNLISNEDGVLLYERKT
jgi:4-amino-4-deoxy-L-arabinose transferase-like glycosyltransferase